VLHEHVPDLDPNEALLVLSEGSADPLVVEQDGSLLVSPALQGGSQDMPPMVAEPGDGALGEQPGQRSPTFTPDRVTELEGTLDYFATFAPVIAPFKRVTSLDATRLNLANVPVLAIAEAARRSVPVEGANSAPPDPRPRDRFWGQAVLDFSRGRVLPLPSVSPESRILSLTSDPPVGLRVERDGADNFFIVLDGVVPDAPDSPVRVVFLTDAPTTYFAGEIPDAPVDVLAREVPELDARLRRRALELGREIGVRKEDGLRAALHALTAHFRAFEEAREPPQDTGDVLADLVRSKKGVCRHRAYGFVVLAHALGIPTRFVQNEAHSFVEVKLPGLGYRRIDLGGAANGLNAHNARDQPTYQPKEPDSLPRPAAYEESYSQLGRNTTGLRRPDDAALQGRWLPPSDAVSDAASSRSGAQFMGAPRTPSSQAKVDTRSPLLVTLDPPSQDVLRGRTLEVAGRIEDLTGLGVAGLRVQVSFAAQARRDRLLLGVSVTGLDGRFKGSFGIPPDLQVGDYQLIVVTPGDSKHSPAMAR
jgi:transglutaminase-like putative cysteine protease